MSHTAGRVPPLLALALARRARKIGSGFGKICRKPGRIGKSVRAH